MPKYLAIEQIEFENKLKKLTDLIGDFVNSEMGVNSFIDKFSFIEDDLGNYFFQDSPDEFYRFLKMNCEEDIANTFYNHEKEHAEIDEKYGLKPIWGIFHIYPTGSPKPEKLNEIVDLEIIPAIMLDKTSYDIMKKWDKEKTLTYIKESYDVTLPSKEDRKILDIFM